MQIKGNSRMILWIESIGFAFLILLCWSGEYFSKFRNLFGCTALNDWHESLLESAVIVIVWALVFTFTRKLLKRLHYVESFIRVCAWCKKMSHDDQWVQVADYFAGRFDIPTTHGICPDCAAEAIAEVKSYNPQPELALISVSIESITSDDPNISSPAA
jgi:hypothetical protein